MTYSLDCNLKNIYMSFTFYWAHLNIIRFWIMVIYSLIHHSFFFVKIWLLLAQVQNGRYFSKLCMQMQLQSLCLEALEHLFSLGIQISLSTKHTWCGLTSSYLQFSNSKTRKTRIFFHKLLDGKIWSHAISVWL